MSKRKAVIELQSKPENKAIRRIIEKTKPVEFAPINLPTAKPQIAESSRKDDVKPLSKKSQSSKQQRPINKKTENPALKDELNDTGTTGKIDLQEEKKTGKNTAQTKPWNQKTTARTERLRIFQTSTPVTRTLTKFQKAAIVVRGENGKQLVELLWRDQMNEKTRDIWDFLCERFVQAAEELKTDEVLIRKRDILEGSGVKSDRTFISAIYTLEDMGLIEVRRLSGNKEGNNYILTEEGREEIDGYRNSSV